MGLFDCECVALMVDCVDHKHTNKIPPVLKEQLAKLFSTPSLLPDKEVILLLNKIDLFKGAYAHSNVLLHSLPNFLALLNYTISSVEYINFRFGETVSKSCSNSDGGDCRRAFNRNPNYPK